MVDMSILETLKTIIEDPKFQENVEETARIFFQGTNFTVNLIPALAIGLLGLLLLAPLLGIPLLDIFSSMSSSIVGGAGGYGAPATGYGQAYRRDSNEWYDQTIADLQSQVTQLQDSEQDLRSQLYYSNTNTPAEGTASQIGYTT